MIVEPVDWSLRAARYRWAELLRQIFEVDPLACPWCRGLMRIVAVITDPGVITRILAQRARAREDAPHSRSPPSRRRRAEARPQPLPLNRSPGPPLGGAVARPRCPASGWRPPSVSAARPSADSRPRGRCRSGLPGPRVDDPRPGPYLREGEGNAYP